MRRVVVTFHFEAGRVECLSAFSTDPLRRAAAALGSVGRVDERVGRVDERYTPFAWPGSPPPRPHVLAACGLPEPTDLILENLAYEKVDWLSESTNLILENLAYEERKVDKVEGNRAEAAGAIREASTVAVIANTLLRELVSVLVAYERRTLRSHVQLAIALKLAVAQV
ncbi:hypothetical protein T492DRAFT_889936 [Pavlovales sp. CCMP2436]|nr:hypothetical protein T492DRAFT_889936 [Pavlovales sp. CCMP2436]